MWPNPEFPADLVLFAEEILNEKLHFLCSGKNLWLKGLKLEVEGRVSLSLARKNSNNWRFSVDVAIYSILNTLHVFNPWCFETCTFFT